MRRAPVSILAGAVALGALGQSPAEPPAGAVEAPAAGIIEPVVSGLYMGPATCGGDTCHGATRPRDLYDVNQNEYHVWLREDRHARAWETLFEERSRVIAANLGLGAAPEAPACLACHALTVPAAAQRYATDPIDGVSCEACHGPASGWRDGHNAEDWTHARSVAAGMTDLADLRVRTSICLGCHLGEAGRRVDHDLIAAGHPALQFELQNFGQAMPAHWRSGPEDRLHEWSVGQAAAFRASAVELGRRATDGRWPDFSALSCAACHHDLEEERWIGGGGRAATGAPEYRARIGLPSWSPARWATLRVLVERYAPDDLPALDAAVEGLARPVSRLATPPAEVAAAADELARRLEPVTARLAARDWRPEEARAVALDLASRGEALSADVDTAAQAVQGLYALTGYLLARRPETARGGMAEVAEVVEALAALAATVERPETFDRERFRSALAALGERLR